MKKTLLYFGIFIFLFSCKKEIENEKDRINVTVERVQKRAIKIEDSYPANIVALKEVELRADVSGYITGIFLKEGQRVKKGQVLYEIDQSRYASQHRQAQAALEIAESNQIRVERDLARYQKLREGDAIANQIYDNALTDLQNIKQEVEAARAMLDNAATDLKYAKITAPFDGTIGFSQVRLGTLITQGQSLLNTISEDDPIGVDVNIEERYLSRFLEFQNRPSVLEDSIFSLRLPDYSRYPYPGKIEIIDRAVNRNTGTIQIRFLFPNPDFQLKPGLSATLFIKDLSDGEVLLVPNKSLIQQMGETFLFRVEDNVAHQVRVKTGRSFNGHTVIVEGISDNDVIVIDGLQKIEDGEEVEIKETKEG